MSHLKIRRVVIEGYRKIQERLELNLVAPKGDLVPYFVIAGPNGCGKTSVLEAILLGLGRDDLVLRDDSRSDGNSFGELRLATNTHIDIDIVVDDKYERTISQNAVGRQRTSELTSAPIEYFSSWRAPLRVGAVKPLIADLRPTNAESNRLWRLKQRIVDERSKRAYSTGDNPAASGKEDRWLARLNAAWRRFHGNDGTSLEAQIIDVHSDDVFVDLFVMKRGQRICSIDQASSGEIEIVSIAGWMILSDVEAGLILIDEPELHLHQEWQSTIMPALRELAPNVQFIIATHADAPWDQAYSFERHLLVPKTDARSGAWRAAHVAERPPEPE